MEFNDHAQQPTKDDLLTGRYVDKKEALIMLEAMNINWTPRQIDWTAEPNEKGHRKWPWFLDDKGVLRIDAGIIHSQFEAKQQEALQRWLSETHNQ